MQSVRKRLASASPCASTDPTSLSSQSNEASGVRWSSICKNVDIVYCSIALHTFHIVLSLYDIMQINDVYLKPLRKINVAYNNAFRMIMQLPRYCSASDIFAMCIVPSCQAVTRNLVYRFTIRVDMSANKLLCAIGSSDIRYHSRIRKHWISSLYVYFCG